jgi:radical SAM superfamily enzyme YgiQ (UPF0313 family)
MEDEQILSPEAAMLPVGPLAIATSLRERGHEVHFVDYVFAKFLPHDIDAASYDAVLIAIHTLRNIPVVKKVLASLRGAQYVVAGGNVCMELGIKDLLKINVNVDAVVRGYGHGVIEHIERKVQGDILAEPAANRMQPPDVGFLDGWVQSNYLQGSHARYPIIGPGGFGCAWSCNYCTAKMGSPYVKRSLREIEKEISVAKSMGYRELWCVDNLALIDPNFALEFDDLVYNSGMSWLGMTRAETIVRAEKHLPRFRALTNIAIGVETSDRQLRALNRGIRSNNEELMIKAFGLLNSSNISSTAFVILDIPGSNDDDFWNLINLLSRIQPGNISWSFFNPPAKQAIRQGLDLSQTGFYRWPLGFASIAKRRVVQQAMLISGTWWMNWAPNSFFQDNHEFGVRFDEGEMVQPLNARSPIGDLWKIWEYRANC